MQIRGKCKGVRVPKGHRVALNQDQERRAFLLMELSHDFRTPIGLIKGYAEAIEDDLVEPSPSANAASTRHPTKVPTFAW